MSNPICNIEITHMTFEIAIIKNVTIGMGDRGEPVMSFECLQEGCISFQILSWKRTYRLLKETGFKDIKQFEGKPCIVKKEGDGGMTNVMIFQRMMEI